MSSKRAFGGVDLGGTSVRCVIATSPDDLRAETSLATGAPDDTLRQAAGFFREQARNGLPIRALGLACFGPIDLDANSARYGEMLNTPKPGWRGAKVLAAFKEEFSGPVVIDTDVNAAALGERDWGGAQGVDDLAYVTVGTGVGAGIIVAGAPVHGARHPEAGHVRPRRAPGDDFPGACPFHGDCIEGLASGEAIRARTGRAAAALEDGDSVWALIAFYLGELALTLLVTTAPRRIIFGGGVMARAELLDRIRAHVKDALGAYGDVAPEGVETIIQPAGLGARAGALGAIALARRFADSA